MVHDVFQHSTAGPSIFLPREFYAFLLFCTETDDECMMIDEGNYPTIILHISRWFLINDNSSTLFCCSWSLRIQSPNSVQFPQRWDGLRQTKTKVVFPWINRAHLSGNRPHFWTFRLHCNGLECQFFLGPGPLMQHRGPESCGGFLSHGATQLDEDTPWLRKAACRDVWSLLWPHNNVGWSNPRNSDNSGSKMLYKSYI